MGKHLSKLYTRATTRFNIENRAFRELDKQQIKPVRAPLHKASAKEYKRVLKENPDFAKKENTIDQSLDNRLKQVYVTSSDAPPVLKQSENADKGLPLDRSKEEFEMGFKELERDKVPAGKVSLRNAIQFITDHRGEPDLWTIERISKDFNLEESTTKSILNNFQSFELFVPDKASMNNTRRLVNAPPVKGKILPSSSCKELSDAIEQKKANKEVEEKKVEKN